MGWLIFAIFVSFFQTNAQVPTLKSFTTQQSLAHNTVNIIFQDSDGFIWIGTLDGITRYDGYHFQTFRYIPTDNQSISGTIVVDIIETEKNELWIATNRGLNKLDKSTERFTRFLNNPNDSLSLSENNIHSIFYDDRSKNIWVCTAGGGLNILNTADYTFKVLKNNPKIGNSISDNVVFDVYKDSFGNYWVLTAKNGVDLFNPSSESFLFFPFEDEKPNEERSIIEFSKVVVEDNNKNLLIGSIFDGLYVFNIINHQARKFDNLYLGSKLGKIAIQNIYKDYNGRIWIATDSEGICVLPNDLSYETWYSKISTHDLGLTSNAIGCIYIDKMKGVWIGTTNSGLCLGYEDMNKFSSIKELAGLKILRVFEDSRSNIWVGTDGDGIFRIENGSKRINKYDNPRFSVVKSFFEDKNRDIWIGAYMGGISKFSYQSNNFIHYFSDLTKSKKDPSINVWDIVEDKKGNLWFATLGGGLIKYNISNYRFNRIMHNPEDSNSLITNHINCLRFDKKGNFWVGTAGEGLERYDTVNQVFYHYNTSRGGKCRISDGTINALHEDEKGNLWVATSRGLNYFIPEQDTFLRFFEGDGLPDNAVMAVLTDRKNRIWVSTINGLALIKPRYNGTPAQIDVTNFGRDDGLLSKSFIQNSAFLSKNGQFYFGSSEGVNVFHPDSIRQNPYAPPVVFTELRVFNEPVLPGDSVFGRVLLPKVLNYLDTLVLSYKVKVFSISFAALHFVDPSSNKYAYMLEGFDTKWSYIGPKHEITYTNLTPGVYTLMVKASNNDGIWTKEPRKLKIIITPPLWQRPIAYFLYILLFLIISYYFRKVILLRERFNNQLKQERFEAAKQKELNDAKLRFFTNISHEFRTPLTLIAAPLDKILRSGVEFDIKSNFHLFEIMNHNTKRLLKLVNQVIDFRKIEFGIVRPKFIVGNLKIFIGKVLSSFEYLSNDRKVTIIFKQEGANFVKFDPDILEKILYNIISNALKNSREGGEIAIQVVTKNEDIYTIEISDNGVGMSNEVLQHIFERFYTYSQSMGNQQTGAGIGLSLTRELVDLHKGHITVESKENIGTKFLLSFQLVGVEVTTTDQAEFVTDHQGLDNEFDSVEDQLISTVGDNNLPLVLLIDDNLDILRYLSGELVSNFRVITAKDGNNGYELALREVPDIIISDVMMPGKDGFELCRCLKTNIVTSHIPVVLLTAKTSEESQLEGFKTLADAYIVKPFNFDVLHACMQSLLQNRQKLQNFFLDKGANSISKPSSVIELNPKEIEFIQKACDIVLQNIDSYNLTPDFLASKLNLSRIQLYRKMDALIHKPVSEFIKSIRLEEASKKLKESEMTISEVAYAVGFKNPAHFTVAFTKAYGHTPSSHK